MLSREQFESNSEEKLILKLAKNESVLFKINCC
jgi:hypothetical protein